MYISTEGASICMVVYPGLRLKGLAKMDALNRLPYSVYSWETITASWMMKYVLQNRRIN